MEIMSYTNHLRIAFLLIVLYGAVYCNPGKRMEDDAKKGELLFISTGCPKCHSISGENMYGPPLNDISGEKAVVIRKGNKETILRDRRYIIRSITQPEAEKLPEYKDKIMPPVNLTPEEIKLIADYIEFINAKELSD